MEDREVVRTAVKVSSISIVTNILLSLLKLLAGLFGKSMAMVSDAVHSLSDVFGSLIVIIGVKMSKKQADSDHPYGHERMECLASLALAVILFFTGGFIVLEGLKKILNGEDISTPGIIALLGAVLSIAVKEAMYWYKLRGAACRGMASPFGCNFLCWKSAGRWRRYFRVEDFGSDYGGNHRNCDI